MRSRSCSASWIRCRTFAARSGRSLTPAGAGSPRSGGRAFARVDRPPARRAGAPVASAPPAPRPVVRPSAPERYHVKFTIGEETHRKLRRVQTLLRREIPDGDPGAIFDRALAVLLEKVEKAKLGATPKPRSGTVYPSRDG